MKGSNKMFAMKVLLLRCVDLLLVCDTVLQVMEKEKIMKSQSQIKHANQEKMIMMGLEHPNIVRLWYAFQTPSKMYVPPLSLLLLVSPLPPPWPCEPVLYRKSTELYSRNAPACVPCWW